MTPESSPLRAFQRPRESFEPAYLRTMAAGLFADKVREAVAALHECRLCPRCCGVDRLDDAVGVCGTGRRAHVASAFAHFGEEDCLRGTRGSGTIFFSGCGLHCVFCQNFDISWQGEGQVIDARQLASVMLDLQRQGCHNINFVTPEHVVAQILESICIAVDQGLRLPIVYNTSGYDSMTSLALLDGVVDVYMPDFKVWDPAVAKDLLLAEDYPRHTRVAIKEMYRQVGDLVTDEQGLALRGLLVRHLVMPNHLAGTRAVMRFLAQEVSPHTYVNLMNQYRPAGRVLERSQRYSEISRQITRQESVEATRIAVEEGIGRLDGRRLSSL